MMNLLRLPVRVRTQTGGRDSGQKHPNSSLHNHHYAPQNYIIFASLPRLLATIPLSPAGSWKS